MSRHGSERRIEMHWICSACGQRNLGRHKECQRCGDPKQASEPWVMPGDTAAAPTVSAPALLEQAKAGADWQCHYCGSYNRRLDACCAQCGAAVAEGTTVRESRRARARPAARRARPRSRRPLVLLLAVLGLGGLCLVGSVAGLALLGGASRAAPLPHKEPVELAEVGAVRWTHQVEIERLRVVTEEGFAETRPDDAFDVESLGDRHHHDEQVLDHHETETYTEQVPYQDTETYTDQEPCGRDCTPLPEHCSEHCTPDDNGFATCRTTCTGGGETCTTRYCTVTKTRQVTRYRPEARTRQVPVYRSEPRHAEYFRWHVWRWTPARTVEATGSGDDPLRWPTDEELAPPEPLAGGEQERHRRVARYEVELVTPSGRRIHRPSTEDELARTVEVSRWWITPRGLLKPYAITGT